MTFVRKAAHLKQLVSTLNALAQNTTMVTWLKTINTDIETIIATPAFAPYQVTELTNIPSGKM